METLIIQGQKDNQEDEDGLDDYNDEVDKEEGGDKKNVTMADEKIIKKAQ